MFTSETQLDTIANKLGGFTTTDYDGWHLADGLVIASLEGGHLYVAGQGRIRPRDLPAIVAKASTRGAAAGVRLLMQGSKYVPMTQADQATHRAHRSVLDHVHRRRVPGLGTFLWADVYGDRWEVADDAEALAVDVKAEVVLAPSWRGVQVIVTSVPSLAAAARTGIRWPVSDVERDELATLDVWRRTASSDDLLHELDRLHPRTVGARRMRGLATGVWA